MKLSKVRRVLTKRLGYLQAKIDVGATPPLIDEHDALETALRCLGMLDERAVETSVANVIEKVVPAEQRVRARARRGDELAQQTVELVSSLQRAARTA